jgi:hypothetical protein
VKVINEDLLNEFRGFGKRCEWCGRLRYCHAAHIFSRGAGRVDIPGNLVCLCWECHGANHNGHRPLKVDLLAIAAARERTTQDAITEEVYKIRRSAYVLPS